MNFLLLFRNEKLLRPLSPFLIYIICTISSCTNVGISYPSIPTEVIQLSSINRVRLKILSKNSTSSSTVGHQYVLFVIPFGRVKLTYPEDSLYRAAYTESAMRGFAPTSSEEGAESSDTVKTLRITLEESSVTAYDLLFLRRNSCTVTISADLLNARGEVISSTKVTESTSEFQKFGFKADLERVFTKALNEGISKIFNDLRLTVR